MWALEPQTLERPHLNKTGTSALSSRARCPRFFNWGSFARWGRPIQFLPSAVKISVWSLTGFIRTACKRPSCDKQHQMLCKKLHEPFSQPGHFRLLLKSPPPYGSVFFYLTSKFYSRGLKWALFEKTKTSALLRRLRFRRQALVVLFKEGHLSALDKVTKVAANKSTLFKDGPSLDAWMEKNVEAFIKREGKIKTQKEFEKEDPEFFAKRKKWEKQKFEDLFLAKK